MSAKKFVIVACGIFNIAIGALGAFAGGVLAWMTSAMGSTGEAVWAVPLLAGGILYAGAGVCFLLPNQRAWGRGIALQSAAILMGMVWVAFCLIAIQREGGHVDPGDGEVLMFVILPAVCVLVALAEFGLLWWLRPVAMTKP